MQLETNTVTKTRLITKKVLKIKLKKLIKPENKFLCFSNPIHSQNSIVLHPFVETFV